MQDLKTSISQGSVEQNLILNNYQKLNSCLRQKVSVLENEKVMFSSFDWFLVLSGKSQESQLD